MGKKVRSAKGVVLDFDLLRLKEKIASAPKTVEVKAREDFIDKKLRRRLKKKTPVQKIVKAEPVEETPEEPTTEE